MAQRGRPHILERFAAKSGTSFMAVKYFLRNCEFVPAMKSSFSSNSAAYLLSEWHALCTCDAIASICAATVFVGLNGESIPPSVVTGSFFVLVTLVNTMRNTRARHVPFSIMGSITSVKSALPVTSWNSRLKSPSSKDSGTTVFAQHASASFVKTHAARWSVSTKTAWKGSGNASIARRNLFAHACQPSPRRAHSGTSFSSKSSSSRCVCDHDVAPALGTRNRFGGISGLWSLGRIMYGDRSKARGGAVSLASALLPVLVGLFCREKNAPKIDEDGLRSFPDRSSTSITSGACSRSRINPSARVSHVVLSTVTCRPFIGAPKDSRALPPSSNAVWSLYSEKSITSTFFSGRALAASHAV
mmetsp:Transcript_5950/g.19800  ORF Transcript_5950/g.19800 Transcript_5950/m.19800 type:complete len:359 (-) Transcript_5950:128-1204(-)